MSIRTRYIDNAVLLALVVGGLLVLAGRGCMASRPALAQEGNRLTPDIALARLCISEAGWECLGTGDGWGIHEVILRGAAMQGVRYETYARAYARRLFGARPHDVPRLRWVGQLGPACTEPAAWPTTMTVRRGGVSTVVPHAPWSAYRQRCLDVFAQARQIVSEHDLADVDAWGICERPVHDWGGAMDRARAERIGLVPVSCGLGEVTPRNDFYCRPSIDPDCVDADRD